MAKAQRLVVPYPKELIAALDQLPLAVLKKILSPAIRKTSKPMLAAAKENTPVDTGMARKALKVRAAKRSRKNKFKVVLLIGTSAKAYQGEQFYFSFLEFGTRKAKALGIIRAAYDSKGEEAKNAIITEIKTQLPKVIARLNKTRIHK